MDDGKEIDTYQFMNIGLENALQRVFEAVQLRIEDLERLQLLQLGPLLREGIARSHIENAMEILVVPDGLWSKQSHCVWHYNNPGVKTTTIAIPPSEFDQPSRPALYERQFLMIAACEEMTPAQLYDRLWPDKRDVVTRLSEVPADG